MAKPPFNPKSPAERHKLIKVADLKPNMTYTVTRDVTNPHGDRRTKGDWRRAAIVPAGLLLYSINVDGEIWLEPFERDVPVMPGARSDDDTQAVDLYYELLLALEPAEKSTTVDLLRAAPIGVSGMEVVEMLARETLVEARSIYEAITHILADEDVSQVLASAASGVSGEQILEALVAMETVSADDVKLAIDQLVSEIQAENERVETEAKAEMEAAAEAEVQAKVDAEVQAKADAEAKAKASGDAAPVGRRKATNSTASA